MESTETMRTKYASTVRLQYGVYCGPYLASMLFGYVMGYSSPAIASMKQDGSIDDDSVSWFGSSATLGAIFGCIIAGLLVSKYGRRFSLLVLNGIFLIGWVAIAFVSGGLFIGRLITGFASGMVLVTVPTYIVETTTSDLRGTLGSGVQLSVTAGIFVAYSLGLACNWKSMAIFAVLVTVCCTLSSWLWSPESPRFLMMSSQKKKALKALISIRGYAGPEIDEELRDLEEGVSSVEEGSCLDLVTRRHLLWPLLIVVGLMLFQQLSGINAVLFYTVEIFESGNFKKGDLATVFIGALMLVSTLAACVLIDKTGRRVLLLLSGLGMAVSLGFLGLFYFWTFNLASVGYEWMPLVTLASYVVSFSLGWGPVPMLVMSELFPAKVRGAASSVASIANWTFAFIVTKEFEALTGPLREHGTFWLFGGCSLASLVFVWFFVPETKGKSLEDIELQFVKVSPLVHK